jgi:hypothetical protein
MAPISTEVDALSVYSLNGQRFGNDSSDPAKVVQ